MPERTRITDQTIIEHFTGQPRVDLVAVTRKKWPWGEPKPENPSLNTTVERVEILLAAKELPHHQTDFDALAQEVFDVDALNHPSVNLGQPHMEGERHPHFDDLNSGRELYVPSTGYHERLLTLEHAPIITSEANFDHEDRKKIEAVVSTIPPIMFSRYVALSLYPARAFAEVLQMRRNTGRLNGEGYHTGHLSELNQLAHWVMPEMLSLHKRGVDLKSFYFNTDGSIAFDRLAAQRGRR